MDGVLTVTAEKLVVGLLVIVTVNEPGAFKYILLTLYEAMLLGLIE